MVPKAVVIADSFVVSMIYFGAKVLICFFNVKTAKLPYGLSNGEIGKRCEIPTLTRVTLNNHRRSYHDREAHVREEMNGALNPLWNSSRRLKRYDPHTRKYRKWFTPEDWTGYGVHGQGIGPNGDGYPRFTRSEGRKMLRKLARGHRVDPARMGDEWASDGPRVGTLQSH